MRVEVIRKRRNGYAVLFAVSIGVTVWLSVRLMAEAASIFGVLTITLLILLVRQSRLLYDAGLIRDNRILTVPTAVVSGADGLKTEAGETIVSTFGLLIGDRVYKWGCDGLHGVRLMAAEIDRVRIYLAFGDRVKTWRVELVHGLTDPEAVREMQQMLLHETNVSAVIRDW